MPSRVVAFGGGTGLPAILRGLRSLVTRGVVDDLIAVVTMTDDGGSSGVLRRELLRLAVRVSARLRAADQRGPSPRPNAAIAERRQAGRQVAHIRRSPTVPNGPRSAVRNLSILAGLSPSSSARASAPAAIPARYG